MSRHPLQPEGEALVKAVRWLARQDEKSPEVIEEASRRYDLSPADEEFLMRHFLAGKP